MLPTFLSPSPSIIIVYPQLARVRYKLTMKFAIAALSLLTSVAAFTTSTPRTFGITSSGVKIPVVSRSSFNTALEAKQTPHGGSLVDLMTKDGEKEAAIAKCTSEVQLTPRQLCDVELIMNGGFSPITGFMDEASYNSVVESMELPNGLIFGLPVVFDTDSEDLQPGMTILLKDGDRPIATVEFTDKFLPNKPLECLKCYGTSQIEHPGALMVATERGKYYMGGKVTGLNAPIRDFPAVSQTRIHFGIVIQLVVSALESFLTILHTTNTIITCDIFIFRVLYKYTKVGGGAKSQSNVNDDLCGEGCRRVYLKKSLRCRASKFNLFSKTGRHLLTRVAFFYCLESSTLDHTLS